MLRKRERREILFKKKKRNKRGERLVAPDKKCVVMRTPCDEIFWKVAGK